MSLLFNVFTIFFIGLGVAVPPRFFCGNGEGEEGRCSVISCVRGLGRSGDVISCVWSPLDLG